MLLLGVLVVSLGAVNANPGSEEVDARVLGAFKKEFAKADLKKNYQSYWISNLFEAATSEGTTYYITIEDADHSIVLKSDNARDWDQYKKVKKS